jgi:manganese-dependent inorganic pyrophosphatase
MVKVFGHKAPDTDATCAPIAYAWFLKQKGEDAEAFVLGGLNRETKFVLEDAKIQPPKLLEKLSEGEEVTIIDTNNPEELPENISEAKIKTIIDHHKLAGLTTESPLEIYMKPVGCSSTLVWELIQKAGLVPSKEIAILMLSAILSDTLKFTSPTTTDQDKKAAEELTKIAVVDVDKHAEAMFAAKSDLTGMIAKDILMMDSKVFDFAGKKVRISSLETTKPENAKAVKDDLVKEMEKIKLEEKLHEIFFFIVNILETSSELLVSNDNARELSKKAFGKDFSGDYMILPGVVSRKKQMAPAIEKVVS